MAADVLKHLEEFADITKSRERLAPYTYFKIGGPAEALVQPRSIDELCAVVSRCSRHKLPMHVLGGGCNILVRDEGVAGVVVRLSEPAFTSVKAEGNRVQAGSGAALSALISEAARHGLAGLEVFVGTPGTVGGAVKQSTGDRAGEIGQFVHKIETVDREGAVGVRRREELGYSGIDDPVILAAEFELEKDFAEAIVKRMRKAWIQRKAAQPLSFQAAGRIFKNPRGLSASALIAQAGLAGARVGGAEVSERDANYIVAEPGTSARDVLRLIDLIRSRVEEQSHIELELEISVW